MARETRFIRSFPRQYYTRISKFCWRRGNAATTDAAAEFWHHQGLFTSTMAMSRNPQEVQRSFPYVFLGPPPYGCGNRISAPASRGKK